MHIVFVGAGHAHSHALTHIKAFLDSNHRVTVIGPGRFYYSGMAPGWLGGQYAEEECSVDVERMLSVSGAEFIRGRVVRVDAPGKSVELEDGSRVDYDLLSLNLGSAVDVPALNGEGETLTVKPIRQMRAIREHVLSIDHAPLHLVVAGGGAAGCEMAANLRRLTDERGLRAHITLLSGGHPVLARHGWLAGHLFCGWCRRHAVNVVQARAVSREASGVRLDDGRVLPCDLLVAATGVRPPSMAADSGLPVSDDGSLVVNDRLQCPKYPSIFGGGDCIAFQGRALPSVGVHAVREGRVLHRNLLAAAAGEPLKPYRPRKHFMLILNLGGESGLLVWGGLAFRARWVLRWKERIDRGFIAQSLG
jgi:NADH dehydrogenase FAD-containing subunit